MGKPRVHRSARGATSPGDGGSGIPPLSDGEIHHLWWFIQGSIMEPDIRWRLRRAWGTCERHAWGGLAVETAFRQGYLHGPAVLYDDLMERAVRAFDLRGTWQARRLSRRLRPRGPCMMCELGLGPASRGAARAELLQQGRDPGEFHSLASKTRAYWRRAFCGRCSGDGSSSRCRRHLVEDASRGVADLAEQRALVRYVAQHLKVYRRSFVWGHHGTETEEDRAALISAVGWCSGWRPLISFLR